MFHLETNSKSGKIYLLATMKYTWCAYLPPFTVINYYSNFITILLSFKSLKLSRFCFFLITRLHVSFTIIIFSFFCFCFKWLVQIININLLKKKSPMQSHSQRDSESFCYKIFVWGYFHIPFYIISYTFLFMKLSLHL